MKDKSILIWDYAVDAFVFENKANGIAVQLYFWALTFISHGWKAFSITTNHSREKDGIRFLKVKRSKVDLVLEWIKITKVFCRFHPQLVIFRGADRRTFPIALLSRLFKIKFVFFAASDVNFVPGKELVHGIKLNRTLYQRSIRHIPYIVVQNSFQRDTLFTNYNKPSLVLANIWLNNQVIDFHSKTIDVIWVSNFRRLKRAEWIVRVAENNPGYRFAMVGRPSVDIDYYEWVKSQCSLLSNLDFYGPRSFCETNNLISQSRVLVCTSEFEGFPNTFLQAWAYSVPVVSTVNPSNVISDNNLGIVVKDCAGLNEAILHFIA